MTEPKEFRLITKTLSGFEEILAEELSAIGARNINPLRRAVEWYGDKEMIYKVNYLSRLSLVTLKPIKDFPASNHDLLYDGVRSIDWVKYFDLKNTISVKASTYKSSLDHTQYIAQKTKDGIVDYFRDRFDERPDVDTYDADIQINVHLNEDYCEISMNSTGSPLFKRGYRQATGPAPLNEVLAAGMIQLSGWDKVSNFVDPMCGSGTLAIEAAMLAINLPAGYFREKYSFMNWLDFDAILWKKVKEAADSQLTDFDGMIFASDISPKYIEIASENIHFAKLHKDITLKQCDIANLKYPEGNGTIIINPPYGERIRTNDISELYKIIGDSLKFKAAGYNAWVISSDLEAIKLIGMRPMKRYNLFNGALECKYNGYSIYEGSKKDLYKA
jgi:putative N6-adenine-specific DNA methylase